MLFYSKFQDDVSCCVIARMAQKCVPYLYLGFQKALKFIYYYFLYREVTAAI